MKSGLQSFLQHQGYEKFDKIKDLNDVESLLDPENEPFKSKYKARTLLQEFLAKVQQLKTESNNDPKLPFIEAALQYYLGVNFIQTEERPSGEECLNKCIELLGDKVLRPEGVSIALSAKSELGILWSSRYQGADDALKMLEKAEEIYEQYKSDVDNSPLGVDELLQLDEKRLSEMQRKLRFEKIYTHILFYLAQVHKNLENSDKSATYCQLTLRRQLESKIYDAKEWALNSACLSQYYIAKNMFAEAKHCLSCANVIVEEAKQPLDLGDPSPDEDEEMRKKRNALPQTKADIARCWVKYFLSLLEYSKERISDDIYELDSERQLEAIEELKLLETQSSGDASMDEERMSLAVNAVEKSVRHLPVTTFEEAREVFVASKKYTDSALDYFKMDGYVTDNVELNQDMSALFKHVAFFENDKERKCKMHKRRIDMLAKVLNELNPQFYLMICRQLQFELGEIYHEMLDLKVSISNARGSIPTNHAIKKINLLCHSGILYFKKFLETLKNLNKEFPVKFDDQVEHPAIVATFYLARLYSKIIAPVKSDKLKLLQQSLQHYSWIVDYVDRNPECEPTVPKEVEICREMKVLLPKSMERYTE